MIVLEFRVHTFFACILHCTGERTLSCHGAAFTYNLKEKIELLNSGNAVIMLVDRWDSVCRECLGKEGLCDESQMRKLDLLALDMVNEKIRSKKGNRLKINEIYIPSFRDILNLRQQFRENGLRGICSDGKRNCKYYNGCVETAEKKYLKAIFMPEAVPV